MATRRSLGFLLSIAAFIVVIFLDGTSSRAQGTPPAWQPNTNYSIGTLATYNSVVYRCIQGHTSLVGWEPPNVPALWQVNQGLPTNTLVPASNTPRPTNTQVTGVPTATPLPSLTPRPTNTSVNPPTATSSGTCSVAAWNSTTVYLVNDLASYTGRKWRAKWWTQNNPPSAADTYGPWEDQGPCSGGGTTVPSATPIPSAVPSRTNTPVPTVNPPTNTPGGPTPTRTTVPTSTPIPPTSQPGSKRIIGYFTQWGIYDRNYLVKDLDTSGSAAKMTHINYAFGNIKDGDLTCYIETRAGYGDGWADFQKGFSSAQSVDGVADVWDSKVAGNFNQLKKLKAKYPQLKVLISLGGWTWSRNFSDAALTAASRSKLVTSCINLYIKGDLPVYGGQLQGGPGSGVGIFDGIDIDWEYPAAPGNTGNVYRPEDRQNFTLLLAEFRSQLNALTAQTGKPYLLTIAAPAGSDKYTQMDLGSIHPYLDFINLMAYDYFGAWAATGPTNFHARLYTDPADPTVGIAKTYSTDTAVTAYLAAGIPANKLVIGIPFYGRGWTNVPNIQNGKLQSSPSMQAAPALAPYGEAGYEDYKRLKTLSYPSFRDPVTQSFWIYNGSTWWSYDDPNAIQTKMTYIKSKGLGGAMAWSMDGDDGTLLNAIHVGLQ